MKYREMLDNILALDKDKQFLLSVNKHHFQEMRKQLDYIQVCNEIIKLKTADGYITVIESEKTLNDLSEKRRETIEFLLIPIKPKHIKVIDTSYGAKIEQDPVDPLLVNYSKFKTIPAIQTVEGDRLT